MSSKDAMWIEVLSEEWDGPVSLRIQGRSMVPTLCPGDQVTVEPVAAADLRPGDWVALRRSEALILHRFLGVDGDGLLLTKGDNLRYLDAPWPPEALLGRVMTHSRQGEPLPVSSESFRARALTHFHRLSGQSWLWLHRAKRVLLPILLLCLILAPPAQASVDLLSFEATVVDQAILVTWETASETDMLGFYLKRASEESGPYQPITDLILATGDPLGGGSYEHLDTDVVAGNTYYYKLEAMELNGTSERHGPVSATVPAVPTDTPTPTPTFTLTPT